MLMKLISLLVIRENQLNGKIQKNLGIEHNND